MLMELGRVTDALAIINEAAASDPTPIFLRWLRERLRRSAVLYPAVGSTQEFEQALAKLQVQIAEAEKSQTADTRKEPAGKDHE